MGGGQNGLEESALTFPYTVQVVVFLLGLPFWRAYLFWCTNKKNSRILFTTLAERYGVTMPAEELLMKANAWELSHGGLTGRTAQQFIDHVLGTSEEQ